jgi:diguanylate cyclase (GGDEF)-like protein
MARNRLLVEQLKTHTRELERLNARFKEMADRDGLTELFNHRYFRHALEVEVAAATRHGRKLSLILLDVDHFKLYNDAHGHLAGDEVLRTLARILESCAGSGAVCARYGGEEFTVILPGLDRKAALLCAESMRHMVQEHRFAVDGQARERATISMGVACCPDDGTNCQTLIDRADEALYRAKQAGRNAVRG